MCVGEEDYDVDERSSIMSWSMILGQQQGLDSVTTFEVEFQCDVGLIWFKEIAG